MIPPEHHQNWEHVYLLGWEDHQGKSYLSSWLGSNPWVEVVVHGVSFFEMSGCLWNGPVPRGARLQFVESSEEGKRIAQETGGYHAFGWYSEARVSRTSRKARLQL